MPEETNGENSTRCSLYFVGATTLLRFGSGGAARRLVERGHARFYRDGSV